MSDKKLKSATNKGFREAALHVAQGFFKIAGDKLAVELDPKATAALKAAASSDLNFALRYGRSAASYAVLTDPEIKIIRALEVDLGWMEKDADVYLNKLPCREGMTYDYDMARFLASGSSVVSGKKQRELIEQLAGENKIPVKLALKGVRRGAHGTSHCIVHLVDKLNAFDSGKVKQVMIHSGYTQSAYVGNWFAKVGFCKEVCESLHSCKDVTLDPKHEMVKQIKAFAAKNDAIIRSKLKSPITGLFDEDPQANS